MKEHLLKAFNLLNKKEKKNMSILFMLMLIGAMLEILSIGLFPLLISVLSNPASLEKHPHINSFLRSAGIQTSADILIWGAITIMLVFIAKNLFMGQLISLRTRFMLNTQVRLSVDLLERYYHAPYTFHLNRNTTDMFSKVSDEVRLIVNSILLPFISMVMDLIMALSVILLIIFLEPLISVVIFAIFALAGVVFTLLIRNKLHKYGVLLPHIRSQMHKHVYEGLGGYKDAKVLKRESYFISETKKSLQNFADASRHQQISSQLTKPFLETIAIIAMLSIVIFITVQGRPLEAVLSVLALFSLAAIRLLPSLNAILSGYTGIKANLFTIDPVYKDFKDLEAYRHVVEKDEPILALKKDIVLKEVSYQYPQSQKPAISGINLHIKNGEAIAFVGSSGAGKTTLVDVLLGLLDGYQGGILIDDAELRDHINGWQKNIGYIPQQIYLSDNTIRSNIAFGIAVADIDKEKLQHAIHAAQLEELVQSLPEGLDTEIGERGVRLSGGQRQRIGIARALYHNPQVLIMDEATSALDNITEKYVVEAIERLKGDRTIITIAHRLSTVKNCDRLYLMKGGRIISQGTYDELLENSAEFREMAK